jgi:GTP-binding protein
MSELSQVLFEALERSQPPAPELQDGQVQEPLLEHMVFRPAQSDGFVVRRSDDGTFAVEGKGIERLLARFDVENEDAMAYLEGRLRRIGVLAALQAKGFQPGDELQIGEVTFELDPRDPA